jgi:peptidoglycan/xylan/chitin deacetylase (PgdA/CDA1 family)
LVKLIYGIKEKKKSCRFKTQKSLSPRIELGLHSYAHGKYDSMSASEINEDFEKCFQIIEQMIWKYTMLAYPYGNFPKESKKCKFQNYFRKQQYQNDYALEIKSINSV